MLINAEFTIQSTNRPGGSLARVCNIGATLRISPKFVSQDLKRYTSLP